MKILYKTALLLLLLWLGVPTHAQEMQEATKRRVLTGFSGGMMLHTGYLFGEMPEIGHTAKGAPFGIGGKICIHLGQHWMIGSEGYVSTLRQLRNGSYIRYGWGGVLGAFYWSFPHVAPYAGLTVGGGGRTAFLMFDGNSKDWQAENTVYFHKQSFCAVTPFIGCDFIATSFLHITVKADWLCPIARDGLLAPNGPRFYVGVIFYH